MFDTCRVLYLICTIARLDLDASFIQLPISLSNVGLNWSNTHNNVNMQLIFQPSVDRVQYINRFCYFILIQFTIASYERLNSKYMNLNLNFIQSFTWYPLVCAGVECLPVVEELGAARPLWPGPPGARGQSSIRAGAGVQTKLGHGIRKPCLLESIT